MPEKLSRSTIPRDYARTLYLGLGFDRSIRAVAAIAAERGMRTHENTLKKWSRDDGWVEAAREFDAQTEAHRTPAKLLDAIADEVRHVSLARAAQDLAEAAIRTKRFDANGEPRAVDMTGSEIARLLDVGIRNERLVSGKATERLSIMTSDLRMLIESVGPSVARAFDMVEQAIVERVEEPVRSLLQRVILDSKVDFARRFDSFIEAQYTAHGLSLEAGEALDVDD